MVMKKMKLTDRNWDKTTFAEIMSPAKVVLCGNRKDLPVLSITMHDGIVEQKDRFKKVIASHDTSKYKVVKNGQLVIAFPIDEGLIYTQDVADEGIMSPAYNVWDVNYEGLDRRFLGLYFHSPVAMAYYKDNLRGTTQRRRSLPKDVLLSMPIPMPALVKQKEIVSELDGISSTISLLQSQISDLDALKKSTFYDMFGEPELNDKGWDSHTFEQKFKLKSGDSLSSKEFIKGEYPVYGGNGISGQHNAYNMDGDYIIVGRVGAYCGNARNVKGKFWLTDNAFNLIYKKDEYNSIYLTELLSILDLHKYSNQAAQPVISNITLKGIQVIIPPMPLQLSFASKVGAVEEAKASLNSQIAEMQTLLAARMQYWFE